MSLATRLSDLAYAIGTDMKQLRTFITGSGTGDLTSLNTTDKSGLVAAINEVNAKPSAAAPGDASEAAKGIVELASLAEVAAGVDIERAVTPAGVRQERAALKAEILGSDVPAALDTLDELAAALGDDANFAATLTTGLGNRLRFDQAQVLTGVQQTQGQDNLGVYSRTQIGDPETDLVAAYAAAKA